MQTEDRVDAGGAVAMEQGVGEVSAVVDDDIVRFETIQVAHGAPPLVAMRDEIEVKGELGFELVEAAQ